MIRYIIWTFIFYLIFRFIFNFLLPVFRASKQMRQQVRDFQGKMNEQENFAGGDRYNSSTPGAKPEKRPGREDYIDFEEVK